MVRLSYSSRIRTGDGPIVIESRIIVQKFDRGVAGAKVKRRLNKSIGFDPRMSRMKREPARLAFFSQIVMKISQMLIPISAHKAEEMPNQRM